MSEAFGIFTYYLFTIHSLLVHPFKFLLHAIGRSRFYITYHDF